MRFSHELARKSVHLSSVWMIVAIYFLDKQAATILFSVLWGAFFLLEYLRMTNKTVASLSFKLFRPIMRPNEAVSGFQLSALTGSFYFLLAVLLSVILFARDVSMVSIAIMIFADTMAALVGKGLGRIRIMDKTLEGSVAFFVTAVLLLFWVDGLSTAGLFLVAFVATLIELFSQRLKINDNLSITLCVGGLVTLLSTHGV